LRLRFGASSGFRRAKNRHKPLFMSVMPVEKLFPAACAFTATGFLWSRKKAKSLNSLPNTDFFSGFIMIFVKKNSTFARSKKNSQ
jgi:hypothetical protein